MTPPNTWDMPVAPQRDDGSNALFSVGHKRKSLQHDEQQSDNDQCPPFKRCRTSKPSLLDKRDPNEVGKYQPEKVVEAQSLEAWIRTGSWPAQISRHVNQSGEVPGDPPPSDQGRRQPSHHILPHSPRRPTSEGISPKSRPIRPCRVRRPGQPAVGQDTGEAWALPADGIEPGLLYRSEKVSTPRPEILACISWRVPRPALSITSDTESSSATETSLTSCTTLWDSDFTLLGHEGTILQSESLSLAD
ncbi:hypothetical protein ABEF93_004568 [Exophiala dermatitidis]